MPLKLNKGNKVAQIWGAPQIGRSDFAKLQKPNDVNNTNKCENHIYRANSATALQLYCYAM